MVLRRAVLVLAVAGLWQGREASGRVVRVTVSDSAGGAGQTVFSPDTPAIVVTAWAEGVAEAGPLVCRWIAEDIAMAPPDYQLASETQPAPEAAPGAGAPAQFRLARPRAGWPVGRYRVELAEAGQPATTVRFRVQR